MTCMQNKSIADQSELLGLNALTFVAQDADRLARFLDQTGITPQQLRAQASNPGLLAAVLDHLMRDESLLLVFTASSGAAPESIAPAHAELLRQSQPASDE